MDADAKARLKQAQIEAVVIRKDGRQEDLGVVSYWNRNPIRRVWWRLTHRRRGT
jgi:hypothetical protein